MNAPGAAYPPRRRGITLLEVLIALSALGVALTMLAEVAVWSIEESLRTALHQDALEAAANVLEDARTVAWEDLGDAWTARQTLPEGLARRMDAGRLTVTVEPEPGVPRVKRVTVQMHWKFSARAHPHSVRLVGLFAARSADAGPGGTP